MKRLVLRVGMLMTLALITACGGGGGGEEANKPRPLPEANQALRPGTYSSKEFKPSLTFRVGKGWETDLETADLLYLTRGGSKSASLGFWNLKEVYKPTKTGGVPPVVDAPEDMVGWFQSHPHLQTDEPEQLKVGGVKGVQFDVSVEDLPEDYTDVCGTGCVNIGEFSDGTWIAFAEGYKERVGVLEDVNGETVITDFGSRTTEFDEFAPEAQKVIDSVEWEGS
jgi:hypothetical protein